MDRSMKRSSPLRLYWGCGCSCSTKTTSPASPSGISSAFSEKWILWPSGAPLGMCTSSVSCTFTWRYIMPLPPHESHVFCTCWIMGPIRIVWILPPRPRAPLHDLLERHLERVHHVLALLGARALAA